jgi:hypothetical protein
MRLPRLRRRRVALAIVVVLVALSVRALDSTLSIDSYRVVDDRTLAVRIGEGPGAWTRITNIAETPSTSTPAPPVPETDAEFNRRRNAIGEGKRSGREHARAQSQKAVSAA